MIICLECNREFKIIGNTHLKKHGLTQQQYLEKYPNSNLFSEEYRKNLSISQKGKVISEETKRKLSIIHTGKKVSEETKKKLKENFQKNGHPWLGKHHSDESKKKNSESQLKRYEENPNLKIVISEKTKEAMQRDDVKEKYQKGLLNRRDTTENLGKYVEKNRKLTEEEYNKSYSDERNNKISEKRKYWWKNANPVLKRKIMLGMRNNHKIKLEIENLFNVLNVEHIAEYEIEGKFYDYYLPEKKILVEIDGEYWHAKDIDINDMDVIQRRVFENDNFKNNLAKQHNFQLKRFWVKDVRDGKLEEWIKDI